MRVTKTRIETTLYDTNGNKISVVKQKTIEVEIPVVPTLLSKKETQRVRSRVQDYKNSLKKAESIREDLHKSKGFKHGQRIFHSMADLVLIVDRDF